MPESTGKYFSKIFLSLSENIARNNSGSIFLMHILKNIGIGLAYALKRMQAFLRMGQIDWEKSVEHMPELIGKYF